MQKKNGFTFPSRGTDLPAWFLDDLKALDKDFKIFYHPYRVMYEDVMNEYSGRIEDPRLNIRWYGSDKVFGRIQTDIEKKPLKDGCFHLWRYCWPHGYAHIVRIEDKNKDYLKLLLDRLYIQAHYRGKYGDRAWNKRLQNEQEVDQELVEKKKAEEFKDIQKENKGFMRTARENLQRGKIAPTNPQKEQIMSYSKQSRKSRVKRPLTDEEGGLVVPDES